MRAAALMAAVLLPVLSRGADHLASLTGSVREVTGARIAGAVAELRTADVRDGQFRAVSDREGRYRFSNLPGATYDLQISMPAHKRLTIRSIQIRDGERKDLPRLELRTADAAFCGVEPVLDYIRLLEPNARGNLAGVVHREVGTFAKVPIAGAGISLLCPGGKLCGKTTTDAEGRFRFATLAAGNYSVSVTKTGYYPEIETGYEVESGIEAVYWPISIERCGSDHCDPRHRPKKPTPACE